ncbi:MAG: phage tail protein I [Zoogloeaceae bacterium]|jgi:phage tail P2-like protein|nr:phage tail protein I [Zoogloeaceae bacterium]
MSDARRLLPPNSTALERAVVAAADEERLAPEVIAQLWDAAACPAAHLPWLAWALSVDEWDEAWEEAAQRRVIAASIAIHRKKGTVGAVKQALAVLGHRGRLVEWHQTSPMGVPHTFQAEIEIDDRGIDDAAVAAIERQIIAVKPARSHFFMRLIGTSRCNVRVAAALVHGEAITVWPLMLAETAAAPPAVRFCIGWQAWSFTAVYPL